MQIDPYLFFNGNCEEAFKFYARCLNGKIADMMLHEGSPAEKDVPANWQKKILHARLEFGDGSVIMGSDAPPSHAPERTDGFSISVTVDTPQEAERVFKALSEKAHIKMPIQETFWAQRFGMLDDQFGMPWMINCNKPR
jgi:PhnB protein